MAAQRITGTTNDSIRTIIVQKDRKSFVSYCLQFSIIALTLAVALYAARVFLFYTGFLGSYTYTTTAIIAMTFFLVAVGTGVIALLALFASVLGVIASIINPRRLVRAIASLILSLVSISILVMHIDLSMQLTPVILEFLFS